MPNDYITKKDLEESNKSLADKIANNFTKRMSEMSDAILAGMDKMFREERKFNQKTFATKDDLKREVSWLRDDIKGLEAELSDKPSREQFKELKSKVDVYLTN